MMQNNRHLFLMSMYKFWLLKNIPTTSIIMSLTNNNNNNVLDIKTTTINNYCHQQTNIT